jgi:4-hydroxyphenylpyruvate dioxygenase-like putative hemolysin
MNDFIIPNFWDLHPLLKRTVFSFSKFNNDDSILKKEANDIIFKRTKLGLNNLVKGLQCIVINTEESKLPNTIEEMLLYTGYEVKEAFTSDALIVNVLKLIDSCDIIISSRKNGDNPFTNYNLNPKSMNYPDTRVECFIFEVENLKKYFDIQCNRGINFLTKNIVEHDNYYFIQTIPSSFTGTSYGFIQWKNKNKSYKDKNYNNFSILEFQPKPDYTKNITYVDHAATRITAKHRDAAILELMELTSFNFDFSIYIKHLNSITNVARMKDEKFALVFTSGISPFSNLENSGPTEKFVYNYGPRVHHIAFYTNNIESTFEGLKNNNLKFLIDLVGSEEEGIKQTFSYSSKSTLVVNEYICRYGDFHGFFTEGNVRDLTYSTNNQ